MMDDDGYELTVGRYTCPLCDERFNSIGDKKRHIRTEHESE